MTTDDILLETLESIDLTIDGGVVEHLRGLLEGGGRHEALRLQGSTCDPLEDLASCRRLGFAYLYGAEVTALEGAILITELTQGDDLPWAERLGVASVGDHDLAP